MAASASRETVFDPASFLRIKPLPLQDQDPRNVWEVARKARAAANASQERSSAPSDESAPAAPVLEADAPQEVGRARLGNALERLRQASARQRFIDGDEPPRQPDDDADESVVAPAARAGEGEESITGTLSSVRVFNDWALGTIWTPERESRRVTGQALIGLTEGLEYVFHGTQRTHSTHGESLEVRVASPTISNDDDAIERFLVKSFNAVGKARAAKYIAQVREQGGDEAIEQLRQKLLSAPWELDLTAIAGNATFAEGEDPQEQARQMAVARNIMLRTGAGQGVREGVAKDLASWLIGQLRVAQGEKGTEQDVSGAQALLLGTPGLGVIDQTWAILAKNPYAPIKHIAGYGFATAEAVARVVGIPPDAQCRLSALVAYAAENACERRGHTFLSAADFKEAMIQADPRAPAKQALVEAIREGAVIVEGDRIYLPHLHQAELRLAKGLARLMESAPPLTKRSADDVRHRLVNEPGKIAAMFESQGFDDAQVEAVVSLMTSSQRLHVLTGGPGTGKTTIMQALVSMLKNRSFAFAAPTGKAAKVLTGRIAEFGYRATTVHSLLGGSEDSGFKFGPDKPLEVDVLVVDEATMNGVQLADAIVAALPEHAHLIVLGDPGLPAKPGDKSSARAGQLPSIAPGRFMHDLLKIPGINHAHLERTYRNSGGILEVVKEVACSKLNAQDRESVRFSHGLPEAQEGFAVVMGEYLDLVRRDGFENTMLVMPKRQGERDKAGWNTTYANAILREVCNPGAERLPGTLLHLGDRIIVRANMDVDQPKYDDINPSRVRNAGPAWKPQESGRPLQQMFDSLATNPSPAHSDLDTVLEGNGKEADGGKERIVNGDVGRIGAFVMPGNARLGSAEWVRLDLDDGRRVWLPGREVGILVHAYAVTVHAAQGSEYKNVIMVVTPGGADFMNQNMLFTGISRAKQHLSVWGDDQVLRRVAASPMPQRNSSLVERVEAARHALDDVDSDVEGSGPLESSLNECSR